MTDSMRHSLIQAPPGNRFVRIDQWIVHTFGGVKLAHAAAACVAQLEFWHRGEFEQGKEIAPVTKMMDDFTRGLGGLFGPDKILEALRLLEKKGWLEITETTEKKEQLWVRQKKYRLDIDLINQESRKYAEKSKITDFPALGKPENRQPEPRFSGFPSADFPALNNNKKTKPKSSSSYAQAREPAAAADLWIVENPQDQLLEDELLSALPGGRAELNEEAAKLLKAGKRPYLSSIQKSITAKNKKEAAARRQAAEAVRAPPARVKPETLAELRAAISGTRPAI